MNIEKSNERILDDFVNLEKEKSIPHRDQVSAGLTQPDKKQENFDVWLEVEALKELAEIYAAIGDYRQAINYSRQLYELTEAAEYKAQLGLYLLLNGELEEGKAILEEDDQIDNYSQMLHFYGIGIYNQLNGSESIAGENLKKALEEAEKLHCMRFIILINERLASIAYKAGDYQQVITQLCFLEEYDLETMEIFHCDSLKLLSQAYENLGEISTSLKILKTYINLRDRFYSKGNMAYILELKNRVNMLNRGSEVFFDRAARWMVWDLVSLDQQILTIKPLNLVKMNLDLIFMEEEANPGLLPQEISQRLDLLSESFNEMSNSLSVISQINSKKFLVSSDIEQNMLRLIGDCVEQFKPMFRKSGISIDYQGNDYAEITTSCEKELTYLIMSMISFSYRALIRCKMKKEVIIKLQRKSAQEFYLQFSYSCPEMEDFLRQCHNESYGEEVRDLDLSDYSLSFYIFQELLKRIGGKYLYECDAKKVYLIAILCGRLSN